MLSTSSLFSTSSSSSSSPFKRQWNYDVFLSFRGEDTRKNFTGHLFGALIQAGINTFIDDWELRRGEDISMELLKAIETSRIAIIIFSRNYGDSRWCLDELVHIMKCRREMGLHVLPIFYDVDPSHVRKQNGCFGKAFPQHQLRFAPEKVCKWREALTEAANLSGWDLQNVSNGHEAALIQRIVEELINKLRKTFLNTTNHPVGLETRMNKANLLLDLGRNDVVVMGICGMGGLGKTTIAKAVYNENFHCFQGSSFLSNIRESSQEPSGQVHLQEQLLSDILLKKVKVGSIDRGIKMIEERLCQKRVLIVLDDVDQMDQIYAVAGKRNWLGPGSRIIITTRDRHLLNKLQVEKVYMVENLNEEESLQLFSWHAFKSSHPENDYVQISKDVISYAGGLPLALEVLGSFLLDKSPSEWRCELKKLQKFPPNQVQEILRLSFDALECNEKEIFLDIACFFVSKEREYVAKILDGCQLFGEIGMRVLVDKCLLVIDASDKLQMHGLIRDMGREIVYENARREVAKCSRLWLNEDVYDVLDMEMGTDAIEGLSFHSSSSKETHFRSEALAKLTRLRLLNLSYVHVRGCYKSFSKKLRWLCWRGFPLRCIPREFSQDNLVALDLRYSNLKKVWDEGKVLINLKFLNLSHSHSLCKTPDFSKIPNLQRLLLKDCTSLVSISETIGHLQNLQLLNLEGCTNLKGIPESSSKLMCLQVFILSGCAKLDKLPKNLGEMVSLIELKLDGTAIEQVPPSIVHLKNLKNLSLADCRGSPNSTLYSLVQSWVWGNRSPRLLPTTLFGLNSLTSLNISCCNLPDDVIPSDIGSLSSLHYLNLNNNHFSRLPSGISSLSRLQYIHVSCCRSLVSLPELPRGLRVLYSLACPALVHIPCTSMNYWSSLTILTSFNSIVHIPRLDKWDIQVGIYNMGLYNNLQKTFIYSLLQKIPANHVKQGILIPGTELSTCFNFQSTGSSVSLLVPPLQGKKIKGITMSAILVTKSANRSSKIEPSIKVSDKTKGLEWTYTCPKSWISVPTAQDHMWLNGFPHSFFDDQLDDGDQVEISITLGDEILVRQCGLRFIYDIDEDGSQKKHLEVIQYTFSPKMDAATCFPLSYGDNDGDQYGNFVVEHMVSKSKRSWNDGDQFNGDDPRTKRLREMPDSLDHYC